MKRGFTLIELMVSIAIIGILASLMYINITGVKAKNRDAQRLIRVNEIVKALNIYYADAQLFPIYNGNVTGSDSMSLALKTAGSISQAPVDPMNSGSYVFSYQSTDGTDFILSFCLETNTIQGYSQGCGNTIKP
ncbi:MAG: type II secretion system protein [Candidatus Paceibacterota bacterium]